MKSLFDRIKHNKKYEVRQNQMKPDTNKSDLMKIAADFVSKPRVDIVKNIANAPGVSVEDWLKEW